MYSIQNYSSNVKTNIQINFKAVFTVIDQKVRNVATLILSSIQSFFLFPLRYIGSKARVVGSPGYVLDRSNIQYLDGNQFKPYVKYVAATTTCFGNNERWIKPFNFHILNLKNENFIFPKSVGLTEAKEVCFFDHFTGLKVMVMTNDKDEVVICYGALGSAIKERRFSLIEGWLHAINKVVAIVGSFLGFKPVLYEHASNLLTMIKDHPGFQNKKMVVVGHSLAGSFAAYAALKNQLPAVCFNSVPLGAGLQDNIDLKVLKNADKYVTQISCPYDFTSDLVGSQTLDKIFTFLNIRTPGTFGKRFFIPSAYNNGLGIHGLIMGSTMKLLGYNHNQTPADMSATDIQGCL